MCVCLCVCASVCVCVCVCVCTRMYALRMVSTDKTLRFVNTFIISVKRVRCITLQGGTPEL